MCHREWTALHVAQWLSEAGLPVAAGTSLRKGIDGKLLLEATQHASPIEELMLLFSPYPSTAVSTRIIGRGAVLELLDLAYRVYRSHAYREGERAKRQLMQFAVPPNKRPPGFPWPPESGHWVEHDIPEQCGGELLNWTCLLYTSDAADE